MRFPKTETSFQKIMEQINENYTRVHPRDLFNESMLLKSIGRLALLVHERKAPESISVEETSEGYIIDQTDDGDIFISNLEITINDEPHMFYTTVNARHNYPLVCQGDDYGIYSVFDSKGEFDQEFLDYVESK